MTSSVTTYGGGCIKPAPFCIFGIVNCTPDSFYDGGRHVQQSDRNAPFSHASALQYATTLLEEGAHVLDIGGESSRPGAKAISPKEECQRILPLIQDLATLRQQMRQTCDSDQDSFFISVDTYHAHTAEQALKNGADIINDISAWAFDPKLLAVVAHYKPAYILMHSQGTPATMQNNPSYSSIVDTVLAFFETKMNALVKAGLPEHHILLDIGIGFGKTLAHNLELLKNIEQFTHLTRPLLLGISNKSLFNHLLGLPVTEREYATQVCTALMAARGVLYHRVHSVKQTAESLQLVQSLHRST